jgi:hypothetical protein
MPPPPARSGLRLAIAAALVLVGACAYIPEHLDGLPAGGPWTELPLRSWLAEDRIEPRAVAACADPECPQRLAVGVFRASGADADALAAVLRDPEQLARALRAPKLAPAGLRAAGRRAAAAKPPVRTSVEARPLSAGDLSGFTLALGRADGKAPPAFGAALGRRSGDVLEVVLVVGDDEAAVAATARKVARENLGR